MTLVLVTVAVLEFCRRPVFAASHSDLGRRHQATCRRVHTWHCIDYDRHLTKIALFASR